MGRAVESVVEQIMRLHRSLPPRPGVDEVDAARALVRNADGEEQARLDAVAARRRAPEVPVELFAVLQEMERSLAAYQSREQKSEALRLIDLESVHALFDELLQRASRCVPSGSNGAVPTVSVVDSATTVPLAFKSEREVGRSVERISRDDSYLKKAKPNLYSDGINVDSSKARGLLANSAIKPLANFAEDGEKMSLIKLASLIEVSAKKGTRDLNLQGKLMDQVDWIPDSLGKLSGLVSLDLSENRIVALPATIGALSALTKLDLHANRVIELPDSFGDLVSLVYLDLRGNQLTFLPSTLGKLGNLVELDVSSNQLSSLPDLIGNLIKLKKLIIETNNLEELPYTIGNCVSLVELRIDYNRLKGLPEAIGKLESLEILTVRYNNIKGLPTTMASLSKLKEVDASFNELESIPESLCLVTTLVKLNVGNNFADLQFLPRAIGNLEMLEELDISNNQIRILPDSFRLLSNLRVLHAEENPLEVPPRHVAEMGAQAVVQYMEELVTKRDVKTQPVKTKMTWAQFCFFSRPNKRKHDGLDYIKT